MVQPGGSRIARAPSPSKTREVQAWRGALCWSPLATPGSSARAAERRDANERLILFELEGEPPRVLKAGDAVSEPGGDVIHYQGANNLPDAQSQLVVTMFAPPGTPVLTGLRDEPADHALGRSRGGLTTKVHLGCEQGQKPLSVVLTAGQRGDSPQFTTVLDGIRVHRPGGGRPRTRPDRVLADKAYTSKVNREYLRRRGIKATIPVKADQAANRRKKGSKGGRPPSFEQQLYKQRHAVEESFQAAKGQVGLDQHQVRRWTSWHRFTTLALAALAVLAICAADARTADHHAQPDMIELTVNEIRRLINVLLVRPARSIAHRLRWSRWRRRHQARARRAHYARRLSLEFPP
jgi:hypothetical protein